MSLASKYFDQVLAAAEGEKSSKNGTVLSRFFEPIKPTFAAPRSDLKEAGDDLGKAVVEVFKNFERKNNLKFRFTKKQGVAR